MGEPTLRFGPVSAARDMPSWRIDSPTATDLAARMALDSAPEYMARRMPIIATAISSSRRLNPLFFVESIGSPSRSIAKDRLIIPAGPVVSHAGC